VYHPYQAQVIANGMLISLRLISLVDYPALSGKVYMVIEHRGTVTPYSVPRHKFCFRTPLSQLVRSGGQDA